MEQGKRMTFGTALLFALPWSLPSMLLLAYTAWDGLTRTSEFWW